MKHVYQPAPRAVDSNPAVPEPLSRLIAQLMSKAREERPASGLAVRQALDELRTDSVGGTRTTDTLRYPLPAPLADPQRTFVGRRSALDDLRSSWSRASGGASQLVVITGEAGIGKTSLAAAFAQATYEGGACVLYGRCDEDALISYQPFVEALRHLVAHDPDLVAELDPGLSIELAELARLVPELRRQTMMGMAAQSRESVDRFQLFEGVLALLSPAIRRQRMLLVIDDMQWADEPTELLLRYLMRAELRGLMVIVTRRPPMPSRRDPLVRVGEDVRRRAGGERRLLALTLTGLDADETHELASARRDEPVDREFSRLLRAGTEGHPFFIEQVLNGLRGADLAVGDRAANALQSLRVPQEVQDFIEYRLATFGAEIRDVLTQSAVCGPEFRLDVLSELRGEDNEAVISLLSEPLATGLILEPSIGRYAFSHALVRETLYDRQLGKNERAQLHLRIGEALERLSSEATTASELALHFHAAREIGGAERAVTYSLAAARDAAGALAYEKAAAYARDACEALTVLGSSRDGERCRILRLAGRLYWQAGDQQAAQRQFRQAANIARELGDPVQFARSALGYAGRSYDAEAIDPDLRRLFEEALATLPQSETATRARLLARLAEALHPVAGERAIELTGEALDILRRAPDDDALTTVMAARHMALLHIDYHEERYELGKRWIELTEDRRDRLGHALQWRLFDLIERGESDDISDARGTRRRLADLAEELGQPLFRHFMAAFDAKWLLMEGKFGEAEQKSREAFLHGRRAQGTHVPLLFAGQRVVLGRDQGRLEDLARDLSSFVDIDDPSLPAWRVALIMAFSESGDRERARAWLRELAKDRFAGIPRDMFWLGAMCMLAESAAELEETSVIADLRAQLEPYSKYNAQLAWAAVLGPVSAFVGLLAASLGDHAAAEDQFEIALQRCAILNARPAQARIQCQLSESLLARGDNPARATELLERSHATARELGMVGVEERVRRALAQLDPA
jgi:hypothetical protein